MFPLSSKQFICIVTIVSICNAQMKNSLFNILTEENLDQLTKVATKWATRAAEHTLAAHHDAMTRDGSPREHPLSINSKPSEMIGQSLTNMIAPLARWSGQQSKYLPFAQQKNFTKLNSNQITGQISPNNAILNLAKVFLSGSSSDQRASKVALEGRERNQEVDILPTIHELAPAAASIFGMPKGEDYKFCVSCCLPFLTEFMQLAYGDCVKRADEQAWDTWGGQISNVLLGKRVDFLSATKETCKRGAERQHCGQLRKVISECDIIGSLQVVMHMHTAIRRCDEISGIIDQNPVRILDQVNGIIGGEFANGFLHKFLNG